MFIYYLIAIAAKGKSDRCWLTYIGKQIYVDPEKRAEFRETLLQHNMVKSKILNIVATVKMARLSGRKLMRE